MLSLIHILKPGGILIYDGYGIINPPTRKDIKVYRIDAMDAANEMNNAKAFNMIVLGGLLKLRPIVTLENVIKGLKKTLPEQMCIRDRLYWEHLLHK